jgi:hypothetical protein
MIRLFPKKWFYKASAYLIVLYFCMFSYAFNYWQKPPLPVQIFNMVFIALGAFLFTNISISFVESIVEAENNRNRFLMKGFVKVVLLSICISLLILFFNAREISIGLISS